MSKKLFGKFFIFLLVVGLLFAAAPTKQALAQTGGTTLNVAKWSAETNIGINGRPTVLYDGTNYHMWYGVGDQQLFHSISSTPTGFTTGTENTFSVAPVERGSVTVLKEEDIFYLITYGTSNKIFSIHTSSDGNVWTYKGDVFNGSGLENYDSGWQKFDAPSLLSDDGTYKLYFQVKPTDGVSYSIFMAESGATTLAAMADANNDNDFTLANSNQPVLTKGAIGESDEIRVMHPNVVKNGDTYYMWYAGVKNGAYFSQNYAYSSDGIHWKKGLGNPVQASISGDYAEPSVVVVGDTWNLWYMFGGNPIKHVSAKGPFEFQTIQAAIEAASAGDTINVGPGTYEENITIKKANITLQSTGTAAETIIKANGGFGVDILMGLGIVTIDGFTVKGWLTSGIIQSTANRVGTTSRILNNIVVGETGDADHGNCIQVTGDNSLVQGNTVTGAYYIGSGPYGASGILIYAANNAIVQNNTVSGADIGISVAAGAYHSLGPITGVKVEGNDVSLSEIGIGVSFNAENTEITENNVHDNLTGLFEEFYLGFGPTGTKATFNKLVDNQEQAVVGSSDTTVIPADHSFLASPNWWGSAAGPAEGQIVGNVSYIPWCANEACTTFGPDAVDDFYTTNEDATLTIAAPGVLANDIYANNSVRDASLVTSVQHGTLSLMGNGSFTYIPDTDFTGTDTFVYKLITYPAPQSLWPWTEEATVTITVEPLKRLFLPLILR